QALVALITPDQPKADGRYTCKPWVHDELVIARTKGKLAIALVDNQVDTGGAYKEHEFIPYLSGAPILALIKLSRTIGRWKREIGRSVRVRILPDELGRKLSALADSNGMASCKSRLVTTDGEYGP